MGDMDMSELLSLAKKPFPDIEKTFYRDFREYVEQLRSDAEEDAEDREKKVQKAMRYGERIFCRRMKGLFSNVM